MAGFLAAGYDFSDKTFLFMPVQPEWRFHGLLRLAGLVQPG